MFLVSSSPPGRHRPDSQHPGTLPNTRASPLRRRRRAAGPEACGRSPWTHGRTRSRSAGVAVPTHSPTMSFRPAGPARWSGCRARGVHSRRVGSTRGGVEAGRCRCAPPHRVRTTGSTRWPVSRPRCGFGLLRAVRLLAVRTDRTDRADRTDRVGVGPCGVAVPRGRGRRPVRCGGPGGWRELPPALVNASWRRRSRPAVRSRAHVPRGLPQGPPRRQGDRLPASGTSGSWSSCPGSAVPGASSCSGIAAC